MQFTVTGNACKRFQCSAARTARVRSASAARAGIDTPAMLTPSTSTAVRSCGSIGRRVDRTGPRAVSGLQPFDQHLGSHRTLALAQQRSGHCPGARAHLGVQYWPTFRYLLPRGLRHRAT